MCVHALSDKGKGCLGWCVESGSWVWGAFGTVGVRSVGYSVACGGSVVEKRERRRWRGGAVLFALIGRRHVVALLFAGESVVGVYFYSRVLHTRQRKH